MKYTIAVLSGIEEGNVIEKEISVRVDARLETVVRKAAEEIGMVLEKKGLLARPARYWADMPNVWRNLPDKGHEDRLRFYGLEFCQR